MRPPAETFASWVVVSASVPAAVVSAAVVTAVSVADSSVVVSALVGAVAAVVLSDEELL